MFKYTKHIILLLLLATLFSCTPKKDQQNRITIIASYEGASPEAIEQLVTNPLEKAFHNLQTSSIISSGKCVVTISSDVSLDSLRYLVKARLPDRTFPQNMYPPVIRDYIDPNTSVIRYVLKSDYMSSAELYKLNEEVLATELERMPKVSAAYTVGMGRQKLLINPDPQKLNAYEVGVDELADAIERELVGLPSGTMNLAITGKISVEDFQNLVIRNEKNSVILLKDIASISLKTEDEGQVVYFDGQPAIEGVVAFSNELSPVEMEKQFYSVLEQVKKKIPVGITILPFFGTMTETQDRLQLKVQFPPGSAKEEVREASAKIGQLIRDHAGISSFVSETGFSLNVDEIEKQCHTFYISTDRSKTAEEIENSLQTKLSAIPGIASWFVHLSTEEYPADYSLKISASEKEELIKTIETCREKLNTAKGIGNIHVVGNSTAPVLDFIIDREKAGRYGINSSTLQEVIGLYQHGKTWPRMNEPPVELKIESGADPSESINWKIMTPNGLVPLTDMVSIAMKAEPSVILRENRMPLAKICFSVKDEEALKALEQLLQSIAIKQGVTLRLEKDR